MTHCQIKIVFPLRRKVANFLKVGFIEEVNSHFACPGTLQFLLKCILAFLKNTFLQVTDETLIST